MSGLNSSLQQRSITSARGNVAFHTPTEQIVQGDWMPTKDEKMYQRPILYHHHTQPSSPHNNLDRASHTAEFNKILNQQRSYREKGLDETWNEPKGFLASTPLLTAEFVSAEAQAGDINDRSSFPTATDPHPAWIVETRKHQKENPPD